MADLNVMMREQAVLGLQTQLDKAVTDGDTAAARKISDDLSKLAVSTAPKAPPYGQDDILAELNKQEWFGVDPKKSGRVIALGKDMNPKKFASAEAFAAALIKAVDEEFKPAGRVVAEGDDDEPGAVDDGDDDDTKPAAGEKKPRKTDGPSESDANQRTATRRISGPWLKLSDAPADVQKEVKRTADKFVPAAAPKEQREKFVTKALESYYAAHQRAKGKK